MSLLSLKRKSRLAWKRDGFFVFLWFFFIEFSFRKQKKSILAQTGLICKYIDFAPHPQRRGKAG
jgi:hypothetical protein